ncbi:hypothetical protein CEXT_698591 [Caerostris extrusa]|uniref:Uncharacterized protein n=1 Tax=Caerostris extrusa TaxID=172846 RepID=A0AAV4XK90_CAEEX|nr:hypothetical protein CEXT_698591 [Caerostris extrusa]
MPLEIDILCSSGCSFNLLDVPFEAGLQGSSQITLLLKDDNSVWVLTPAEDDFSSPPFYGYLNMRKSDILCSSGCSFNLLDVPFESWIAGLKSNYPRALLLKDDNLAWVLTPAEDNFSSPPFHGYLNMQTLGNMHHSECLNIIYAPSNWAFCVHLDARLIDSMLPSKLDCWVQVKLPCLLLKDDRSVWVLTPRGR